MTPFEKILVPVDFSIHSREALRMAVELGRQFQSAITLVHVFEPAVYALPDGYVIFTPQQLEGFIREFERQLESDKQEALRLGAGHVDTRLLEGFPAAEITRYASEAHSDLIVMGTHGRTGPKHLLLGSVAERVVRTAPCPVLTLKASVAAKQ
jgi:nucleotide-binding universal stress UspA family protein